MVNAHEALNKYRGLHSTLHQVRSDVAHREFAQCACRRCLAASLRCVIGSTKNSTTTHRHELHDVRQLQHTSSRFRGCDHCNRVRSARRSSETPSRVGGWLYRRVTCRRWRWCSWWRRVRCALLLWQRPSACARSALASPVHVHVCSHEAACGRGACDDEGHGPLCVVCGDWQAASTSVRHTHTLLYTAGGRAMTFHHTAAMVKEHLRYESQHHTAVYSHPPWLAGAAATSHARRWNLVTRLNGHRQPCATHPPTMKSSRLCTQRPTLSVWPLPTSRVGYVRLLNPPWCSPSGMWCYV